jgi:hypothetical protein
LYGTVAVYDRARRAGVLKPDGGHANIVFAVADQPPETAAPRLFQRYSYQMLAPRDGGQPRAVNLRRQLSHREQAEAQPG